MVTKTRGNTPPSDLQSRMLADVEREETAILNKALGVTAGRSIDLAKELFHHKEEFERLSGEAKEHKDRYEEIRTNLLPDAMRNEGMVDSSNKGSFTFEGGKINLETRLHVSCTKENKPNLFVWLKKNKMTDLLKLDVSAAALESLVRERREEGLKDPPGLSIFERTVAKMTRK